MLTPAGNLTSTRCEESCGAYLDIDKQQTGRTSSLPRPPLTGTVNHCLCSMWTKENAMTGYKARERRVGRGGEGRGKERKGEKSRGGENLESKQNQL